MNAQAHGKKKEETWFNPIYTMIQVIWNARNNLVFNNSRSSPLKTVDIPLLTCIIGLSINLFIIMLIGLIGVALRFMLYTL